MAWRTSAIVACATARPLRVPSMMISCTRLGFAANSLRRSRIGVEESFQRLEQLLLHLDVADRALAIALLEILDFLLIRIEDVVIGEDRIALDVARIGRMNPRRDR